MGNTLCSVSICHAGLVYWLVDALHGTAAEMNSRGLLVPSPSLVAAEVFVQPDTEMDH